MKQSFREVVKNRRSCYTLSNKSSISDAEIEDIINFAVTNVPSSFNSQSTRVVLLLGDNHTRLWAIVKETLRKILSTESFGATETKVDNCFAAGYGTILYYEDMEVIEGLQKNFPTYSDNFPIWSMQTSGMHQFTIWSMLEEAGLGVSLQHYNPLIDEAVAKEWGINPNWMLMAEMPFGVSTEGYGTKEFKPLEDRVIVCK